jgi:predicted dehydrogenase
VSLENIAVIGGGRWARTIANVLDKLLLPETMVTMYSPHNANGLVEWVNDLCLDRIKVINELPDYKKDNSIDAVIITNAARMHFSAAVSSLFAGIPTLVEKPLTTCLSDTRFLIDFSNTLNSSLYAAHVFPFARYVKTFSEKIRGCSPLKKISFFWTDPITEIRHNEKKKYDASITVMHDVLPHVISIIRSFTSNKIEYKDILVYRGGAQVKIILQIDDAECEVHLERDAPSRSRLINVETAEGNYTLDFTTEPGVILDGGEIESADSKWGVLPSPLNCMLSNFLDLVEDKEKLDSRLSTGIALETCGIIDLAFKDYRQKQMNFLIKKDKQHPDISYALSELIGY